MIPTLPIPATAHRWAQLFASKQPNPTAGKQVYLNTLSVLVVDDYLQNLGIATDLEASASWYPGLTSIPNSTELQIVGLGGINCPPVQANQDQVTLPVTSPEIASIVVQLSPDLTTAILCGYAQVNQTGTIPVSDLLPIDTFPDYLGRLRDGDGRIEPIDLKTSDPLLAEFLADLSERERVALLAQSLPIYDSSDRPFSKRLQLQERLGASKEVSGHRNSMSQSDSQRLEQEDLIRDLANRWLTLLETLYPAA
jgi:hypothetical protein